MNKTLKIAIGIVVAVLVVVCLKNIYPTSTKPENTIKIGMILPLTGEYGALGENIVKGAELAKDEYIKGHPKSQIQILAEDDVLDSVKGLNAYKKLTALENIEGLISASAPTLGAIYEDANTHSLPVVTVSSEPQIEHDDNVFQIRPSTESVEVGIGEYLKSNAVGSKVVIVRTNDALTQKFAEKLKQGFGSEIETFTTNRGGNDYRTIATKILATNPDFIIVSNFAQDGAQITKELLRQKRNKKFTFVFDPTFNEGVAEYKKVLGNFKVLNGSVVAAVRSDSSKEFTQAYKIKYGEEPGTLSNIGYDSFKTIMEGYDSDSKKWIENLSHTKNLSGASGNITFDSVGLRDSEFKVTTIENGELPAY